MLEPEKRLRLRVVIVRLRGSVVAKLRQFLNFKTNFNNFYNLKKNRYTNKKKYYFPFLKLYFLFQFVNTTFLYEAGAGRMAGAGSRLDRLHNTAFD